MPMTQYETLNTVLICQRYLSLRALELMTSELSQLIGAHSENASVQETLQMLSNLAHKSRCLHDELLVFEASLPFGQRWVARIGRWMDALQTWWQRQI